MKYEDVVSSICGSNWYKDDAERHGGYGVACLLAFMRGAEPELGKVAEHLEVPSEKIRLAFLRLEKSGAFTKQFDACNDKWLLGLGNERESKCAWGYIAGIAGGLLFMSADMLHKEGV